MTATFEAFKPDDIKMTLHVTMAIKEWSELKKQLDAASTQVSGVYDPAQSLASYIRDLVDQAQSVFTPKCS